MCPGLAVWPRVPTTSAHWGGASTAAMLMTGFKTVAIFSLFMERRQFLSSWQIPTMGMMSPLATA